jgi:hypothetical protein
MSRKLSTILPTGWKSIDEDPFQSLNEYPSWIAERDIAALIIDQRLDDKAGPGKKHVTYKGHKLVDFLRQRFATLPIYIVTSFPPDSDVTSRFKYVEAIKARDDFVREAKDWVPKIVRSGQRFFETHQKQLTELNKLSLKVAKGQATDTEKNKLKAIQQALELPFATEDFVGRSEWTGRFEETIEALAELQKEIVSHLRKGSAKKKKSAKKKRTKTKKR